MLMPLLDIEKAELNFLDNESDVDVAMRCRESFYFFVKEFWSTIITEDPVFNWHIEYLCNELQKLAHSVIARQPKKYDIIINISPGTTKTTICSILFPVWCWVAKLPSKKFKAYYKKKGVAKDEMISGRDLRIITGSYAQDITLANSLKSRDILRSEKYKTYFPEIEIRQDQDLKSDYANTYGGQRFSTSVGSRVMGQHAHIIIVDDPIDPEQTLSDAQRLNANNFMDNLSTRKVDKAVTPTILIMQRLHKLDPTGYLLDKIQKTKVRIKHICLPATTEFKIKPKKLIKKYKKGFMDPIRLGKAVLLELRTKLGPYGYAGQTGQDPRPREGGLFSKNHFEIVNAAPASPFPTVRGWDLAATSEAEAKEKGSEPAYTAGVKMSYVDDIFYIHDVVRGRMGPNRVRRTMYNTASQDGFSVVQDFPQDPGQAGKAQARSIVAFLAGYTTLYSLESGDKLLRAEPLSAQVQANNVKLVRGAWNHDFLEEADYFPNGFKDQIDAAVRAFKRLLIYKNMEMDNSCAGPGGCKTGNSYGGVH